MEDYRAMFERIREEHLSIRGNIRLVGDSVSDQEALNALRKTRADWIPGRADILSEKQKRLQQTLSFLDEGLQNHFALEARYLPPFLGELFMRALLLEHREIGKQVNEAKSMAADMKLEGLSREELLLKEGQIQQIVSGLCQTVEEHAAKEETLLEMLEKGLQESGRITP
jgi:hemerythrin